MKNHPSVLLIVLGGCQVLLSACVATSVPAPTPTATHTPGAVWTATQRPTETPTRTPTQPPANTPKPSASATLARTRPATATKPPAGPSPTPGAAQICASLTTRAQPGIYVLYLQPVPDLVWDRNPHQFRVGLCNTNPLPSVPQGRYKIALSFPPGNSGATQSAPTLAELKPGANEISVGPWVPGLENHRAVCATRANAQTQVLYNDTPDPFFRALAWHDGSAHVTLPIQCGGDFP